MRKGCMPAEIKSDVKKLDIFQGRDCCPNKS